eukprot:470976-Alexandrium_andersonii.AAC.1
MSFSELASAHVESVCASACRPVAPECVPPKSFIQYKCATLNVHRLPVRAGLQVVGSRAPDL